MPMIDGKMVEDGSGSPPDNVHLIAHHEAVKTHVLATAVAAQALSLSDAAKALGVAAEASKKSSFAAHKRVLATGPVVDEEKEDAAPRAAFVTPKPFPPKFGSQVPDPTTTTPAPFRDDE